MDTPGEKSDSELIHNFIAGNEEALQEVISRYLKPIYNFVFYLCGNASDSEDITQEVFVKVWKNIKKYNLGQSFKTWLFTIARNTTIDWLRKRKNLVFSDFEKDDGGNSIVDALSDAAPLPDEVMGLGETHADIRNLVEQLPLLYKTVLLMRYNEEFTFKEIGEILNKPLDTVKSQHRRALIQLRKMVEEKSGTV